ncbi:30S ribosomal protein S13 [Candidatus Woesearchaeota archaeon]|nr:30S ribosomal protein S13 [Candidatus Woesearchaeota archaeon]
MAEQKQESAENFRYFVRIANTDLDGNKHILLSLGKIKGINIMFANAVCRMAGVDIMKKTGTLSDDEVKRIEEVLKDPAKHRIPAWLFNRRKDPETGESGHLMTSNLIFTHENDIKKMKKIRSYKGQRHASGHPVRGQRTKSNFRKNKGKVSLGVKKKAGASAGKG